MKGTTGGRWPYIERGESTGEMTAGQGYGFGLTQSGLPRRTQRR